VQTIPEITPQRAARVAATGYVALFALAIFANFFVRVRLVEPGDAATTFANLAEDERLVRLAIVAFLAVFVIDVVVAWALHHVFRPAGEALSALTAWFRIVYTVFLGVAVLFLFVVVQLVGGADHLTAFDQGQLDSQALLALEAFNATWLIGLVAFGIHLVLVGTIMIRSGVAPKVLAGILAVAGAAYVFDTAAYALLSNYADHADVFTAVVAVPSVLAEAAFTIWLFRRSTSTTPAPMAAASRSELAGV
jgi:hypothetical protein